MRAHATTTKLSGHVAKIYYRHPVSKLVGWPDEVPKNYNGQSQACDMLEGPCCCGAWHQPGEFTGDFEIRDFPANAPRQLWVEVCGLDAVVRMETRANFKEYLKLVKLPPPPQGGISVFDFLESLYMAILRAGDEGRRFVRLELPKDFDQGTPLSEWLAASGYQASMNQLELTISW